MEQRNSGITEQDILENKKEIALKQEDSAKKFKAIISVMLLLLTTLLIFGYYFLIMYEI